MGYKPHTTIVAPLAVLAALMLTGCEDPHAEDKAAIRACLRQLDQANQECDGAKAVACMSSEALDEYTRLVNLALDGTRDQVLALYPADKWQIIQIRNRMTRREVQGMDGAAYQRHATGECWYLAWDDEDTAYEDDIGKIDVWGDVAYAVIKDWDGDDSGRVAEFTREGGVWKVNEFSFNRLFDEDIREWAREADMTEDEFLIYLEESEWENDIRDSIWDPMK